MLFDSFRLSNRRMKISTFYVVLTLVSASATDNYSFDSYIEDFGKVYATEEERLTRQDIFEHNLVVILEHNNNEGHRLVVNEWTDRRVPDELPLGLQKKKTKSDNLLENNSVAEEFLEHWLNTQVVPVSDLPTEVDWRTHNPPIITPPKQQGFCGSCWAFASSAVLESHIALQTGQLYTFSPQELVSCVDNPDHCGGAGGCDGATYELAYDYIMKKGMVVDEMFPYKSGGGRKVQCTLVNNDTELLLRGGTSDSDDNDYIDGAVATIQGYINFPTNNYTALMNAVATMGPIGVTVAASGWAFYGGGVFSLHSHNSSTATNVNHAVVLDGYGIDQETQEPFWLVRNSWGARWGEQGYIRLKRVDPSTLPDFDRDDCGIDNKPADGASCTRKDGKDIVPEPVKVCGNSAILYDTFVPIGGHLLPNPSNINSKLNSEVQ